jgi:transcriptional regulator with XRE-family HTH domain
MSSAINPVALRTIRELRGHTQRELAHLAGLDSGHVSRIESGQRNPSPDIVKRLAAQLQVNPAAFAAIPTGVAATA